MSFLVKPDYGTDYGDVRKPLRFASVCDGISAVGCAWKPLEWQFVFKSEIEPFPSAVADHHHPEAPNLGDMTKHKNWNTYGIDLICGGTPCQAFSLAGLRKGLADPRGNLTLTFLAVIAQFRPRWVVWENVPGVLSDKTGAFGSFLGGLGQLGYGFAYRILDAQYFGVAQRRRRVFVVGHIGGLWQRAAAVLFERDCLSGNPAPRRQSRERITHDIASSLGASGRGFERAGETRGQDPVGAIDSPVGASFGNDARSGRMRGREGCEGGGKGPLLSPEKSLTLAANANDQVLFQSAIPIQEIGKRTGVSTTDVRCGLGIAEAGEPMFTLQSSAIHGVAHSLRADGFDASEDGTGRGTPLVPEVLAHGQGNAERVSDGSPSLTCNHEAPIGFIPQFFQDSEFGAKEYDQAGGIRAVRPPHHSMMVQGMAVRRLTPRECERLQGFPDDYTLIQFRNKPAADGPRYKALGNSMAVPVMRWIGERIQQVEDLCQK